VAYALIISGSLLQREEKKIAKYHKKRGKCLILYESSDGHTHASATAGHLRYHLKLKIYSAHTFRTYGKNYTANMNNNNDILNEATAM
jgi:acetylornithine deacetylase/succinyl-diaminopimelate desuccinylase-like protein